MQFQATQQSSSERPIGLSGFQLPQKDEKPSYVQNIFRRIASYYDLMNDVMTMGMHRSWKKEALQCLNLYPGERILDVCCGTGDMADYLHQMMPDCHVTGLDFCPEMLAVAQQRLTQKNIDSDLVQGDAMALPFEDSSFNGVIISYGLRNVADYEGCLREMVRVVKPGGSIVILDMSHPSPFINRVSSFYRFKLLPFMGKLITNNADDYRYLTNSIFFYLSQQGLSDLMTRVDLKQVQFRNKLGGVCAIHWGVK